MKKCSKCKVEKDERAFSKGQLSCKQCYRDYYLSKTQRKCLECNALCDGKRHNYCSNECKIIHNTDKIPGGCWEWKGPTLKDGYVRTRDLRKVTKNILAHRLSYELFKGEIPEGKLVLHSCDNRKCVNPKHLWLGSHHDNSRDCLEKGRWKGGGPEGEKNGHSKLDELKVKEIRRLAKTGMFHREIAKIFGVSQSVITEIICNKSWTHVGGSY